VPEQHGGRAGLLRDLLQGGVPGGSRGRLGAAAARPRGHRHADLVYRVEAQLAEQGGHPAGPLGRPGLQPVVHGHPAAAQAEPGRFVGQRGGQRQRVGAARAGGQHQVSRRQVGQAPPDAAPRLGYRRMRAHR